MTWIDWSIVGAFYIILLGVGLYTRKFMRGIADFLVAGRGIRKCLGVTAGGAADMGAISIVAAMEAAHQAGPKLLWLAFFGLGWGIFVGKTGFVIHRYRETKVMTTPELFERRYSKGVRVVAGIICALSGILNMGIFPIVAGRFFTYFAGLPEHFSVCGFQLPTIPVLTAFLIGAGISFAFMGGQVSVVVTDFIQSTIISVMFIAMGICMYRVVQWDVLSAAFLSSENADSLLNPLSSKGQFGVTFFAYYLISRVFGVVSWSPTTQKFSSATSPKEARIMKLLYNLRSFSTAGMAYCGAATLAVMLLPQFGFLGVNAAVSKLDPSIQTQMIAPILLAKVLPVGFMGLMFAGVMAAFISTNDSYILTWAGVIVQDVIYPLRKEPLSRKQHIWLLRIVVIIVGIVIYFFGIFYKPTEAIYIFQQLTGAVYGTGGGVISTLGLYWRRGNTAGAYGAMIIGAIVPIANYILEQIWGPAYPFKGITGALIAMLGAIAAYFLLSYLTKNPHFDLEKMLNRPPKESKK